VIAVKLGISAAVATAFALPDAHWHADPLIIAVGALVIAMFAYAVLGWIARWWAAARAAPMPRATLLVRCGRRPSAYWAAWFASGSP
jgi:hypothetical protein